MASSDSVMMSSIESGEVRVVPQSVSVIVSAISIYLSREGGGSLAGGRRAIVGVRFGKWDRVIIAYLFSVTHTVHLLLY